MHSKVVEAAGCVVDQLEGRLMLSAAVQDGVLEIEGSRRADTIVISLIGKRTVTVDVDGETASFPRKSFGRIRIQAGRGDDLIAVGSNDRVILAGASVTGGDGDDTIIGGGGDDTLAGDGGDDQISGLPGRDRIRGGTGRDQLFGGSGRDLVYGDAGNDSLYGGGENDLLAGGRGSDDLHDGIGDDSVYGNRGDDIFFLTDTARECLDSLTKELKRTEPELLQIVHTGGAPTLRYNILGKPGEDRNIPVADLAHFNASPVLDAHSFIPSDQYALFADLANLNSANFRNGGAGLTSSSIISSGLVINGSMNLTGSGTLNIGFLTPEVQGTFPGGRFIRPTDTVIGLIHPPIDPIQINTPPVGDGTGDESPADQQTPINPDPPQEPVDTTDPGNDVPPDDTGDPTDATVTDETTTTPPSDQTPAPEGDAGAESQTPPDQIDPPALLS